MADRILTCTDYDDVNEICNVESWQPLDTINALPLDDPAVNDLIGAIIALLVLAYVFRVVLNFIFNK